MTTGSSSTTNDDDALEAEINRPDCDWCESTIHRLNGDVEKELCARCLGKAKCGWAPDKEERSPGEA